MHTFEDQVFAKTGRVDEHRISTARTGRKHQQRERGEGVGPRGDVISGNDGVIELETDKAVVEIPCPYAGKW